MSVQLRGMNAAVRPYAELALEIARYNGINPYVTSVYRSWAEQGRLYRRYLAGQSQFPANPPGRSSHNYGLSFDSYVPEPQRAAWTAIRQWVGWKVPGNDWIHAEVPGWETLTPWRAM